MYSIKNIQKNKSKIFDQSLQTFSDLLQLEPLKETGVIYG